MRTCAGIIFILLSYKHLFELLFNMHLHLLFLISYNSKTLCLFTIMIWFINTFVKCYTIITFLNDACLKDKSPIGNASLTSVGSRRWTRHQSVSVPNNPHGLRIIGNHLYQCHGDGITVYDTRLNQLNNIPSCDMDDVYDVSDMSNGDLIYAAGNGLFHTKANSEY